MCRSFRGTQTPPVLPWGAVCSLSSLPARPRVPQPPSCTNSQPHPSQCLGKQQLTAPSLQHAGCRGLPSSCCPLGVGIRAEPPPSSLVSAPPVSPKCFRGSQSHAWRAVGAHPGAGAVATAALHACAWGCTRARGSSRQKLDLKHQMSSCWGWRPPRITTAPPVGAEAQPDADPVPKPVKEPWTSLEPNWTDAADAPGDLGQLKAIPGHSTHGDTWLGAATSPPLSPHAAVAPWWPRESRMPGARPHAKRGAGTGGVWEQGAPAARPPPGGSSLFAHILI